MLRYVLLCILAGVTASNAIVTRHDRDESLYRDLAKDYTMVCRVGPGMGTLVDSLWVLTAAHVADALPALQATARFGDRAVSITQIEMHPDFAIEGKHRDMALLRLAEPVTDIAAAHLYRAHDELNKRVTFVGDGWSGDGQGGPNEGERIMRAAHNTIDSVNAGWLVFTFDAPPAGDDLEGISGPGDSGGPALYRRGDSLFILGVSAYNAGEEECVYGTHEYYSRVSDELGWIEGVMTGKPVPDKKTCVMTYARDESGRPTAAREELTEVEIAVEDDARFVEVLRKLVGSVTSNSLKDYTALFNDDYLTRRRQKGDPLEGQHQFMVDVCTSRGNIEGFHQLTGRGVQLSDSEHPMRPIIFHLEDGTPGYFGIGMDDSGKIEHLSLFVRDGICPKGRECTDIYPIDDLKRASD